MENLLLLLGLLILLSGIYIQYSKLGEFRKELENKKREIDSKFESREKEFSDKIRSINSWQKYIDFNIGDDVLLIQSLTTTDKDIEFTAYIDAKIVDLTRDKAKLKFIDVTISVSNNKITKKGIESYLEKNPWYNLYDLQKKITIEDRRDMQLNKILN